MFYTETKEFKNLATVGVPVNLTVALGTGTCAVRRVVNGVDVDVPVTASGIYELTVNKEPFTVVVTGDAAYLVE